MLVYRLTSYLLAVASFSRFAAIVWLDYLYRFFYYMPYSITNIPLISVVFQLGNSHSANIISYSSARGSCKLRVTSKIPLMLASVLDVLHMLEYVLLLSFTGFFISFSLLNFSSIIMIEFYSVELTMQKEREQLKNL